MTSRIRAHVFRAALFLAAVPVWGAGPTDARIPLFFVANEGQAPAGVRFMAKGSGLTAFFLPEEVAFRTSRWLVRLRMEGANPDARVEGAEQLQGRVNFFTGEEKDWRTGLSAYGAVAYRGLYAGIDMVYEGSDWNLKSEFVVAPGADPAQIRMRYAGAGAIRIDANGELAITVDGETLRERAPVAYQMREGKRVMVEARYDAATNGAIDFQLGAYDRSRTLVIDPVISYSTFLGGSSQNAANAMAIDSTGAVYVAGTTASYNFPTLNPVQSANAGGNDAFVAKLSAAGNALVYATYLGGKGDDRAFGLAVDSTGAAYVTGWTQSSNFPVRNAYRASLAGGQNAFVVKLTPTGNGLAYSTYLGGNGSDSGNGIAVDSSGNAYVVGDTTSTNFPATGFQTTYSGGQDAFIAKLNASGSSLAYSTYLGGGTFDHGAAIAVGSDGTAYVTGGTSSPDFPVANAYQGADGGGQNAFIARLSATGGSLIFSTFLGGSGGRTGYPEEGNGIALDGAGNAYVAGVTSSTNFPLLSPLQAALDGSSDAFVAKMSAAGSLLYSTYLGGSGMDAANAIAVDSSGNAYVAGYTYSIDLPVVAAIQPVISSIGSTDAFVAKLSAGGNSLSFLTYLGGNDSDTATGVAVDASSNIYVTGWTLSPNFPTVNAYKTSNTGDYSAFITKYSFSVGPSNLGVSPSSGSGSAQTFSFQYSDSNGTSDLTTVAALFNASTSLSNACSATYNRGQNTLALLTDGGTIPGSAITPGSGSQQNSQCVLNGAGSSVSLSGNVLTLNLSFTFMGGFAGPKYVYQQASNPYQTTAWQSEGTWSVPAAVAMAVTPSSGNAIQQTFMVVVTDPLGVADLASVGFLVHGSTSLLNACAITYSAANNSLALMTDSGGAPLSTISPGSGTQQNSQCVLNGAASSVSAAGTVVTLNLALTFEPPFGGAQNLYVNAATNNGLIPLTQEGAWTVPPAVILAVMPASGSANQQVFNVQVSDSTGATDLTTIGLLFNATATTTSACAITYNRAQNALMLLTDGGTAPGSSITPGSGTQQNSQCVLKGSGSSVSSSGNTLTLLLNVSFQPAFSGPQNIYAQAANPYETVGWQLEGTWISPPTITMAVSPAFGSGVQQTFAFTLTDSLGATDLTTVGVLFNSSTSVTGACSVAYNQAQNTLALLTDAGAMPGSTIAPGSGTQQNSQCILNGAGSSVTANGNALTLNLALTFQAAFVGTKSIYIDAADPYETVAWALKGTWVSTSGPSISVTPSSGSANQQTFSLQVTDPLGAADLNTVGLLFGSSASTVSACVITYERARNTLALWLDSGVQPPTSLTPGSGTQQNSQCVLNGAGSSVTVSGNTLTVNVAISFQPVFSGTVNLYAEAIGTQSVSWQQQGTWTSPPVVTMAVSPLSGTGTSQRFTVQVTDSISGSDLTTVGLLINASAGTSGACAVIYNSAQNSLALLTDAGAAPGSTITPGSGTQQNSQCVLSGAGSSVTVSGNTLTVNVALTFQPSFTGTKNVYVDAANPYETVNWQAEGVWSIPSGLSVSVSPSSGSAVQQTFTVQATDPAGVPDLTTVGLMFNTAISTAAGCVVLYNRAQNTMMLLTDGGAQPGSSIAPGSGVQQNSSCILNGAGSSVSTGGNVLSVNFAITFQQGYSGTKNLYAEGLGTAQSLSWQQEGIWALAQSLTVGLTPSSGNGTQQTFTVQAFDSLGAADLNTLGFLLNTSTGLSSACAVTYNVAQNALMLLTDAGTAPGSSIAPGSGTQQNSQCVLNGAGSSVSVSGNTVSVSLAIGFQLTYAGTRNLYAEALGAGQSVSWQQEGAWTVPQVITMGLTPITGSGTQQTFSVQASDSLGLGDLATVGILFNTSTSTVGACAVTYNQAQNTLALMTDAGAAPASAITPGSGTQQNSQCILNGAGSSVSGSGATLTVNVALTFEPSFIGAKNVYTLATDAVETVGWQLQGTWVTTPGPSILVTPSSGSANQQTFSLQVTDPLGAADLNTVGLLFGSTTGTANACAVIYNRAQNALMLETNAGTMPASGLTPGSGTQQNSQCVLNGAGSSVTVSGNTLTVNVAISFQPVFSGTVNLYAEAIGTQSVSWQQQGTWTSPPVVTMAVSPLSGTGTSQRFTVQVTDSISGSDLTTVGLLINASAGTIGACGVIYNSAQNSLALLTDAGAAPGSTITPGSGTQQNSQCVLSGAGSSVTVSGNTLTVNVALTFQPSFTGTKNVYVDAANPYETVNWQAVGVWSIPSAVGIAVTPSSGSAKQQAFTVQVADPAGATDLATAGLMFNTTISTAAGCVVLYNRAQNTMMLLTDGGAQPGSSITPGSGTQQNSSCTLNGAGSSASLGGNVLSVTFAITFQQGYTGTKNLYAEGLGAAQSLNWQQEGVWALPQILTLTVSPASGSGNQQVFSVQAYDTLGASDLTTVGFLFNTSTSVNAACAVTYNAAHNTLALMTDAGSAPASTITPGSGSQQNSQCTLSGAGSSVTTSGDTLTVNLAISFQPAFSGPKNLYAEAASSFQTSNWTIEGTWTSPSTVSMSVSPSSGGGPQQVFAFQVTDSIAATDLSTVGILLNTSTSTVSACAVMYNQAQNSLMLLTDAGAVPSSSITPGSGSQSNSQCTLNGAGSTVSASGTTLTLNLSLSFPLSWVGTKTVYMEAVNPYQSGTWTSEGRWVTSATLTVTGTPASGSGLTQTFSIASTESWGATNVTTSGIMINTSVSLASGCVVTYSWKSNALMLLTDAGAAPSAALTPGSGTQQNSSCILNGAGSSVSAISTVLTVNVSITFLSAFAGTKNVYVEAIDPFRTISWTSIGTWTIPQTLTMAVTPSSGGATQQTFSLQATDSAGTADLTTLGIMINSSNGVTNTCAVTYNRAQNALALLTNTGVAPSSTLTPGSGSQSNSQCMLNGASSSVTTSGSTLTLNVAITFLPAYVGSMNIYAEAGTSFQAAAWTAEGTWTLTPAITMAVAPASGGGPTQAFAFQFTDSLAATDLSTVGVLFNTSTGITSACAVMYNRAQNALTLLTDAGAAPAGALTPGSGSQANSQCTLSGAGSSVTTSTNTLTLVLSLSFQASWVGTKTVYQEAINSYQSGTWTSEGKWVTSANLAVTASPTSGSGTQATFTIQATESWGASNVTLAGILINSTATAVNGCAVTYNWAQNTLGLLTNSGAAPSSYIVPGSGSQSNTQCTLNGAGSSASAVGTVLTVTVSVTFQAAFAGAQNVYVEATDPFRALSWAASGTWTVPVGVGLAISPSSGNGTQQTFSVQLSDSLGAADLTTAGVLFNTSSSTAAACAVIYNPAQNALTLLTDAGAAPSGSITPGSGSQSNSQCVLSGSGSSATTSGSTLTVNLAITFQSAFAGVKNVYLEAGSSFEAPTWSLSGAWTAAPPVTMTVAPASGGGPTQVFTFQASDGLNAADVTTLGVMFNSTVSITSGCVVLYNQAQNTLTLLTDGGAAPGSSISPGSGSQQNSQCTLNGPGSTVSKSGITLSLGLSLSFNVSWVGTKSTYMEVVDPYQAGTWTNEGRWVTSANLSVTGSPASGSGSSQTFTIAATESWGSTNVTTAGIMINGSVSVSGGCVVTYNWKQNAMMLLTDAGAAPTSSITPGSGTQQNSSCILNGSGSSVSAVSTVLTVNVSLTFLPAFAGTKNVYVEAIDPFRTLTWAAVGTWTIPLAGSLTQGAAPTSGSTVSPALGSGSQQVFSFQFANAGGSAASGTVGALIGTTASTTGACAILYNQAQDALTLLSDTGTESGRPTAPGSGSQQNSQCALNGALSSASVSGGVLQLSLAVTFASTFDGPKNVYVGAPNGSTMNWQAVGSWTVAPSGPWPSLVTPGSGSGNQQEFSFRYTDTAGTRDLSKVYAWFLPPDSAFGFTGACVAYYDTAQGLLYLSADGGFWEAPLSPGTQGILSNSQCSIDAGSSTVSASGNDLILSLAASFAPSFNGLKNLFMRADSFSSPSSGWLNRGTWTALAPAPGAIAASYGLAPPLPVSMLPAAGSGYQQTFNLQYGDAAGTADIASVWVSFAPGSGRVFAMQGCTAYYDQTQNLLVLAGDDNSFTQSAAPGTPATLMNSQCSINVGSAHVAAAGNNLLLVLPVTFSEAFGGEKSVYGSAIAASGASAGWIAFGSWSISQEAQHGVLR